MYSEQTPTLGLPQWQPQDHPDFLTDLNTAYMKIDTRYSELDELSGTAILGLGERLQDAEAELAVVKTEVNKANSDIGKLNQDVSDVTDTLLELSNKVDTELPMLDAKIDAEIQTRTEAVSTINANIAEVSNNVNVISNSLSEEIQAEEERRIADDLNLANRISTIETEQGVQNNQIANLNNRLSPVEAVFAEFDDVKNATTALQTEVDSLDTRVEAVEDSIEAQTIWEPVNVTVRIEFELTSTISTPTLVNLTSASVIKPADMDNYVYKTSQSFSHTIISYGTNNGEFAVGLLNAQLSPSNTQGATSYALSSVNFVILFSNIPGVTSKSLQFFINTFKRRR